MTRTSYNIYGELLMLIPKKHIQSNSCSHQEVGNFDNWSEVENLISGFTDEWIFRGQSNPLWELVPSIARNRVINEYTDRYDWESCNICDIAETFCKKSKTSLPKGKLNLTAYVQHYGGLTRLLDFTRNINIALFFAFELDSKSKDNDENHAVWTINKCWLEEIFKTIIQKKFPQWNKLPPHQQYEIFLSNKNKCNLCVIPVCSDIDDDRINRQESIFLYQWDTSETFVSNLYEFEYLDTTSSTGKYHAWYLEIKKNVKKIIIPSSFKDSVVKYLSSKNMTESFLLPNDDQFCEMCNMLKKDSKAYQDSITKWINDNSVRIKTYENKR